MRARDWLLSQLQQTADNLSVERRSETEDWVSVSAFEEDIVGNDQSDRNLVLAFRFATSAFLRSHADEATPGGMTWRDAISTSYRCVYFARLGSPSSNKPHAWRPPLANALPAVR